MYQPEAKTDDTHNPGALSVFCTLLIMLNFKRFILKNVNDCESQQDCLWFSFKKGLGKKNVCSLYIKILN